ncbi:HEAT repeat domain-containing protein [Providencia hangzhouensis]|uniref:HEAT repeat domain-containing protein n=1 Tax=Providencia hangzhouensis TaxID=3031799 RepID=UPI0034DD9114
MFYIALLKIKAYDAEVIQYETFLQYLSSPSKEVKIALCDYTKNMGLNSVSETLWQLFNHETDLTIKYAAIEAISWLSDDYNRIYSALIQLIQLYLNENSLKEVKV